MKRWLSTDFPVKSGGTIQRPERLVLSSFPARALAGSCSARTHARTHGSRGQSCHFRGHRRISASAGVTWKCSYNHPDVSNQLGFSSPAAPTSCWSGFKAYRISLSETRCCLQASLRIFFCKKRNRLCLCL